MKRSVISKGVTRCEVCPRGFRWLSLRALGVGERGDQIQGETGEDRSELLDLVRRHPREHL